MNTDIQKYCTMAVEKGIAEAKPIQTLRETTETQNQYGPPLIFYQSAENRVY